MKIKPRLNFSLLSGLLFWGAVPLSCFAQLILPLRPYSTDNRSYFYDSLSQPLSSVWPKTPHMDQEKPPHNFNLKFHLESFRLNRPSGIGDSLDNYGNVSGNTLALRVKPELGQVWEELSPAGELDVGYYFTRNLYFFLNLQVVRALDSWHQDDLGHNLPLSMEDLNINEPSLGYGLWQSSFFDFALGRFPVHWAPSPFYGVTLTSSSPFFDGAHLRFKGNRFRYSYFISSLNTWLSGTPDSFTGDFPVGSEEHLQRVQPGGANGDFNSRNRIYDEPQKTLIAHRVELNIGILDLGISEIIMVGGKAPGLRELNPFMILHNNFGDGYSSGGATADFKLHLPFHLTGTGELFLDEVSEADDGGNPSTFGWAFGLMQQIQILSRSYNHSLHFIKTDPLLYNHARPYLKLTNRHVLKSNFIELGSKPFIDTYVIDYPLGYFRGADAFDFWYDAQFDFLPSLKGTLKLGWLKQGEMDSHTLYVKEDASSPSGVVEEEWRSTFSTIFSWKTWETQLGYGFQYKSSEDHIKDKDHFHQQVFGRVSWSLN